MDTNYLLTLSPLALMAIALPCIGYVLKKLPFVSDAYIPALLMIIGSVFYCWASGWTAQGFMIGLLAGGGATGVNQQMRQIRNGSGRSRPPADTSRLSPEKPWPSAPTLPKTRVQNLSPIPQAPPRHGKALYEEVNKGNTFCFSLMLCLGLLLPGCASVGPANPDSQAQTIRRTAAVVEMGATIGVYYAVKQEPETRTYFEAAVPIIALLASDEAYDPDKLAWALQGIKGHEDAYIAIAASVALYQAYWQDAVDRKLDQAAYCRPILAALARGIKLGLSPGQAEERYPEMLPPSHGGPRS